MRKRLLEQSFRFALSIHQSWAMHGRRLLRASFFVLERCWEAHDKREEKLAGVKEILPGTEEYEVVENSLLYTEATLLLAFALENILKGLWSAQRHKQIKSSDSLPRPLQTHDLLDLAEKTDLSISEKETEGLNVLTAHAKWVGKYPTPLTIEDYVKQHGEVDRVWIMEKYPGPVEFPSAVHSLLDKVGEKLESVEYEWENT